MIEYRLNTQCVPETTYFPVDADRREESSLAELQDVTMEGEQNGKDST